MKLIFIVSILKFHCDEIDMIQKYTNTLIQIKKNQYKQISHILEYAKQFLS